MVDYDADSDEDETEEEEKKNGIPDSSNEVDEKPTEEKPTEPEASSAAVEAEKPVNETGEAVTTTKSEAVETPAVEAASEPSLDEDVDEPAAKRPRTEDH